MNSQAQLATGRLGVRLAGVLMLSVAGCVSERPPAGEPVLVREPAPPSVTELSFGVEPIQDSRLLWSRWNPLIAELNARCTGFRLQLESALSEAGYNERIEAGELDIVLVEPHRVVESESLGYRVFARVSAEDRIGGVLVVRRDARISRPSELAGKRVAFSRRDALASTMLVRHWLREEAGIDVTRAASDIYVGSEDAALKALALGDVHAAGVSRASWERLRSRYPHWSDLLEPRWVTDTLSGPALMASKRVSNEDMLLLRAALLALNTTESGRVAITRAGYHGFRAASSSSYDDVWEFVAQYARSFRESDRRGRG